MIDGCDLKFLFHVKRRLALVHLGKSTTPLPLLGVRCNGEYTILIVALEKEGSK